MTTTFIGDPSLVQLSSTYPPSPDEVAATYIGNGPSDDKNIYYEFVTMSSQLSALSGSAPTDTAFRFDHVFDYIFYGQDPINPQDLIGETNERLLVSRLQNVYSEVMVQMIDASLRRTANPLTDDRNETRLQGTIHLSRSRLAISDTSKLVLQIMLASMTVLGILSSALSNIRGVLPRNPCSIASTMAFLAGSELCSREFLPEGVETMSRREIREVFKKREVSLGWWRTADSDESKPDPNSEGQGTIEEEERLGVPDEAEVEDTSSHESGKLHEKGGNLKFGIDLGVPEVLGFEEKHNRMSLRRRFRKSQV